MSIHTLPEGLHSSTIAKAMRADMDFDMDAKTREAIEALPIREAQPIVGNGVSKGKARQNRVAVMKRIEKARQHANQARKNEQSMTADLLADEDFQDMLAQAGGLTR